MNRLAATALIVCFLGVAACAHGLGTTGGASAGVFLSRSPVIVRVTNRYGLPVEVTAYGGGTSHRLGIVYPGFVERLVLPWGIIASGGRVEIVAQAAGREHPVSTGELLLLGGETVDFQVVTNLIGSYAAVRR